MNYSLESSIFAEYVLSPRFVSVYLKESFDTLFEPVLSANLKSIYGVNPNLNEHYFFIYKIWRSSWRVIYHSKHSKNFRSSFIKSQSNFVRLQA